MSGVVDGEGKEVGEVRSCFGNGIGNYWGEVAGDLQGVLGDLTRLIAVTETGCALLTRGEGVLVRGEAAGGAGRGGREGVGPAESSSFIGRVKAGM